MASAEAFLPLLAQAPSGPAVDLGSGGGVPGLLLAEFDDARPWVLLDVNRRRTSFLARTVALLGWAPRVQVVHAAAEVVARGELRETASLVTARSFGPPAVTAECGAGLLRVGGLLAVAEPPTPDPARWPQDPMDALGLSVVAASPRLACFVKQRPAPSAHPRSWKQMMGRPLWV